MTEMESDPGITVITVTRHRPQTLGRAIASVQAQDYSGEIQHLIIADDDPDTVSLAVTTPPVARRRIQATSVERPGAERGPHAQERRSVCPRLSRLLNFGVSLAAYPWIAFLDDDNEYEPNHLSSLIECATTNHALAVHSGRQMVWPDGSPYLEPRFPGAANPLEGERIYQLMCERHVWISGTNILMDRVDPGAHNFRNSTVIAADDPIFLVDQNLWLLETDTLRRVRIPEDFTDAEIADNTWPDDKLLEALVRNEIRIVASGKPTVRYQVGGVSNGDEQPSRPA
jgi:glycosyltransferase involved in cell wall biosynthesis